MADREAGERERARERERKRARERENRVRVDPYKMERRTMTRKRIRWDTAC